MQARLHHALLLRCHRGREVPHSLQGSAHVSQQHFFTHSLLQTLGAVGGGNSREASEGNGPVRKLSLHARLGGYLPAQVSAARGTLRSSQLWL